MKIFLLRRALVLLPVMLLVSLFSFALIHMAPGDPAEILLTSPAGGADRAAVEDFRTKMGFDQPLPVQYLRWLGRAIQGDLGYSYMTGQPVCSAILASFESTLRLSLLSMVLSLLASIPLGIWSAMRPGSFPDHIGRWLALLGVSVPNFWLAYLLILMFAIHLKWFPVAGYGNGGDLMHMVLPAIALGAASASVTIRLMRSSMLDVLQQDYILAARAKGLGGWQVALGHAMKNALIPVATISGLNFGYMLNGSVVVETIFAWPGIGGLVVSSIYQRDYPMIQGVTLFVALLFLSINLLVDLFYAVLNPGIRYERE
ncbi:MAG TPA: ABC transporter permease [Methanotrichaceae archaeon]|nr:MAG: nickel transporter permease NikB [Methanosaeta sp. PtaU1.Bin028]HOT06143.1 ABC transporter permease [Methanotrichaceae archaeon]HQF15547.1 ABC transporter permease [Methanotrichaceae archaeon]HQI90283.1 ABC transporter permease [Methanotrichaceae archaeon]HQJ27749.1 ABC transporter permease [Methanotrichaceae archaeon]